MELFLAGLTCSGGIRINIWEEKVPETHRNNLLLERKTKFGEDLKFQFEK